MSPNFHQNEPTETYTNPIKTCYSDSPGPLDNLGHDASSPEAPSIEHGNKMLSFQFPSYDFTLLDSARRQTTLSLTAQLHGMFFLAESSRAGSGDGMMPPVELTCYRRNLFQITGCITLPQMMRYVLTDQGDQIPIVAQELAISASESVEGHPIKIISVPWKTPAAGTTSTPEDKTEKEPTSISLHKIDQFSDGEYAKFPIEWKRLQFRVATANNGRRKELQQHFTIKLSVLVTLATGEKVSVCEALSGPIIVRGRSPRNFQQRRDYPLSGTGGSMRKAMQSSSSRQRTASPEHLLRHSSTKSTTSPVTPASYSGHNSPMRQSPAPFFDWTNATTTSTSNVQTPSLTRSSKGPEFLDYSMSSPEMNLTRSNSLKRKAATPDSSGSVPFPNYDTMYTPQRPASAERAPKAQRVRTSTAPNPESLFLPFTPLTDFSTPTTNGNLFGNGGVSSAEFVNKYFPVGMDDWMPPVDPIYKHHGFDHLNQAPMMTVGDLGRARGHRRYMSDSLV